MLKLRLIARLDVKGPDLIKGVQLEGVRKLGDPRVFAERYHEAGIDEIIFMDAVASLYDRAILYEIVERTAENVFVPITIGGGVHSVEDVRCLLRAGADKIAVNGAATRRPSLIGEIAGKFGSQCVVLQIDAKRRAGGGWEALCDGGRERTGRDVLEWAVEAENRGAGEILLTSVDREGTGLGFDVELVRAVSDAVDIPVIASGGMGGVDHLIDVVSKGGASAVAMARVLHTGALSLPAIRDVASLAGLPIRWN